MSTRDRASYIAGLRAVADWLSDHPEVPLPHLDSHQGHHFTTMAIYLVNESTARADLAAITRAMGTAQKSGTDDRFQVYRDFAGIRVMAQAPRDQVCTRVVTGTEDREVEEVVTPAVTRKVVKPVEVVEWKCESILAPPLLATALADAALEADPDGVADAVIDAIAGPCKECGSTDCPLNADGICWNRASCAARQHAKAAV